MNKMKNRGHLAAIILGFLVGGLPAYAATAGNYNGHQAIAGDFNGDGWTDLILQPTAGNQGVAELIAYPDGNFGPPLATWKNKSGGTDWNADAHRLVVGDFNGDGRDDVLLQGAAGLPSQIAYSLPSGSVNKTDYVIPSSLGGLDVSQANHHIVVGDFNGDGRDDILLQANTFVGTNAIALATPNGHFTSLAAKWPDGFKGLSWSLDHASIVAGDFSGDGRDELLMRSDSASGATKCCELMTLGSDLKPDQMKQQWPANYLGVDWDPSTHLAIVGDFNGDGRDDVLLQPMAAGGELDVVLSNAAGHLAILSDKWNSERDGIDWSAQSYMLVPENAGPGKGSTLLMVPKQAGLPYRRASFNSHGRLVSVKTIKAPPGNIFSGSSSQASGGGIPGTPGLHPMALATTNTVSNANTVGTMNGQPSANNGAAGYSIKLAVPPGRAGMQPSLSLSYSSTGGDGHEGVGWLLGGLSSIYRCSATQATDGHTSGTTFSSSDRFCLDGQKLILTSGTYGADASVYHTEVNGFSKIVAHSSQGNGPLYFTVQGANNQTIYYGFTVNSRLADNSATDTKTVFSWSISKSVDAYGNEVDYKYSNNSSLGEMHPTEVDYTLGNGSPGAERKVTFNWTARSTIGANDIVHYLDGMKQSTTLLLSGVQTWVGSSEVRDYTLNYTQSAATDRPLMNSVQVCAYVSGVKNCFEPTTFSYQGQQAPTFAPVTGTSMGLIDTGTYTLCQRSSYGQGWIPLDFNGDGRLDLLSSIPVTANSYQLEAQYGQESNVFTAPSAVSVAPPGSSSTNLNLDNPIDFDLDGLSDFTFDIDTSSDIYLEHDTAQPGSIPPTYTQLDSGVPIPVSGSGVTSGVPYERTLVGDTNGDGRSDMILSSYPATGQTFIQIYQGQDPATHTYPFIKGAGLTIGAKIDSAKPFDYNADGSTDLLIRYDQASYYRLLLSKNGAFPTNVQTNIPVVNSPDTGKVPVYIADVNGDSLPDIIEAKKNSSGVWDWFVYINKGSSSGVFQVEDTGISAAVADGGSGTNVAVGQLRTMRDPDGRTDLVVPVKRTFTAPELDLYACTTDGGYCPPIWPTGSTSLCRNLRTDYWPSDNDGYNWKVYRSTGPGDAPNFVALSFTANNLKASQHLVLDDNADGLPDLIGVYPRTPTDGGNMQPRNNAIEGYQLSYGAGDPMPDLLHQVTNGLGVQTTWTYKPMSDTSVGTRTGTSSYPNMLFKSPMQVVATFSQSNPIGGTNTDTYSYENPKYNVAGRGFSGFDQITVNNEARGLTTTTTYDQIFPFTGRVLRSATSLTGNSTPFSVTTHDWQSLAYSGIGATRYVVKDHESIHTQSDPTSTATPHATATGSYTLISQSVSQQSVNTSNVDLCGNVSASNQTITTQQASVSVNDSSTYSAPGSVDTCWQDVLLTSSVTKNVSYGALSANSTPAVSAPVTTTASYAYNAEESLKSKSTISKHNISANRSASYGYDGFGNRNSVTVKDIAAGTSRTTTTNYGTDGYFPVSITNAKGQVSTATYDPDTGNKTEVIDPNGVWTKYAYDAFGRKLGKWSSGQSQVAGQYLDPTAVSCPGGGANTAAYALERQQPGYPTTYTCIDAFGNTLRTATAGFTTGSWVTVDSTYNGLGELTTKTTPFYLSSGPSYQNNYTSYDVLERLTSETVPTETGVRTIQRSYAGLAVTYTDSASGVTHHYTRYYDGLGKGNGHLVEVQQEKNNSSWVTSTYRYNADGDLVRTTDSAGNAITATYDGFGDKLTLNDPDQGTSSYTYDGYGEQVTSINGRGQTISTTYDALGRPTQVSDSADSRVTNTTYDTGPDAIGKPVTEMVTKNGTVVYTRQYLYDEAGRPSATDITTGGVSYLQGVAYNADGKPSAQAYPALAGGVSTSGPTLSASINPAGPVNLGTTVALNASASDPNGNWALSYQWSQSSSNPAQVQTISDSDTASATVTLPSTAGTYTFTVTVSDGFSQTSQNVSIVVEPPPSTTETPTVSKSISYTGGYTVSWGTNINWATSYELQQSFNSGGWTTVPNTSGGQWPASGEATGTYAYHVRGCNPVGCAAWGGTATVTVEAPPPPQAPLISPNPSSTGSYTVKWGSVSGVTDYQLQESANGGAWKRVLYKNALSWTTSGRGNGTYKYRVQTCNATTGCGAWSATATENVYLPPGTPSLSPSTKTVTAGNNYTISWTMPSGEVTKFQLEVDTGSNTFSGVSPQNVGMAQSETYTAPTTSVEKDIYYRVRACNHSVCGAWSNNSHIFDMPASGGGCQLCSPVVSPSSARRTAASTPTKNSMTTATTTTSTTTTNYSGGTGAIVVNTTYNADGYPVSLTRQSDGYVYMQVASMDVWGHATMVYEGGASASSATVTVTRVDDPATGLVTSLTAANASTNTTLASFTSAWDGFGNLTQRTAGGSTETATYDALNRLTGSTTTLTGGGGTVTDSYTYSDIGNRTQACSDTSCTAFTYGTNGAGPHAVSAVNGVTTGYAYDADGEMTQDNNRTLTWSAFGKAMSIAQSSTTLNFSYGPGGSRYKKVVTGPASETVTYLGGTEVLNVNGSTSIRRTIGFAGLSVIDTGGTNAGVHFAIPDHLGSTMALIAGDGTVTQGLSYGDFGKRYTSGWTGTSPSGGWLSFNTTLTDKGYTGQESLDSVGLDDDNARLYDPGLGRFLSVDPLIGHPGSTQSINPYSYVENNPLNRTDPTGQSAVSVADSCNSAGSHLCSGSSTGTVEGPREAQDAIGKEVSNGTISKAAGKALSKVFSQGARTSNGLGSAISLAKTLSDGENAMAQTAAQWSKLTGQNASFNPNTHSQSSGSSGAGSPTSHETFGFSDHRERTFPSQKKLAEWLGRNGVAVGYRNLYPWYPYIKIPMLQNPFSYTDQVAHENLFFTGPDEKLHNLGYFEQGGVHSDPYFPGDIRDYEFFPVGHNISLKNLHPAGFGPKAEYSTLYHNCQDYIQYVLPRRYQDF